MKEKILYIVIAISVGINIGFLSSLAYIQMRKPPMDCPPRMFDSNFEHFDKVKFMMDKIQEVNIPYAEKIEMTRTDLFNVLRTSNPDTHRIDSLLCEISLVQKEIEKNVIRNFMKLKSELPDSEISSFMDHLERRSIMMNNRFKRN